MTGFTHGDVHWTELMTRDPAAARGFYEKTVGWRFVENPMGPDLPYLVAMRGETAVAGVFDMNGPEFDGMPAHWMTYIAVDDVDAACVAAQAAGGTVTRPAFDVPRVGRIAMVADSTGAVVGLMTPAPPA